MNVLGIRVAVTGTLLVLAAVSGIIVSALGRPLNTLAFTLHKLIAVSAAVLAVMAAVALLSFDRPVPAVLSAIHKAAPLLTVASAVLLAYLLRTGM